MRLSHADARLLMQQIPRGVWSGSRSVFRAGFQRGGHERFGRWNRPNQVARRRWLARQGAESESQSRLHEGRPRRRWRRCCACSTPGTHPVRRPARHRRRAVRVRRCQSLVEPFTGGDPALAATGTCAHGRHQRARWPLAVACRCPVLFLSSLRDGNNPESGFAFEAYTPRFLDGLWALHNRFWRCWWRPFLEDYRTRVRVTHDIFVAVAELTARDGQRWFPGCA